MLRIDNSIRELIVLMILITCCNKIATRLFSIVNDNQTLRNETTGNN